MNEFYTDTLVLRSTQMKQRFREDARFEVLSEPDPFLVLTLKQPESPLVDIVDVSGWRIPIASGRSMSVRSRRGWKPGQ